MKWLSILLLLLVACQVQTFQKVPVAPDYNVGTDGLRVGFNPASNSDISLCGQANVYADLNNRGVFDIDGGTFNFIFDNRFFTAPDAKGVLALERKSVYNPRGGDVRKVLQLRNIGMPEQFEFYSSPVIFQACYAYQTRASVPVCIDPDVLNLNSKKVCVPEVKSLSGGQGAPVAITRVETLMGPSGDDVVPSFIIHLQNVGNGQIVDVDGIGAACGSDISDRSVLSSVAVVSAKLQDKDLVCSPLPVSFRSGEARVSCMTDDSYGLTQGTFSTVLSVQVDYGYVQSASFPVNVKRVPGAVCWSP